MISKLGTSGSTKSDFIIQLSCNEFHTVFKGWVFKIRHFLDCLGVHLGEIEEDTGGSFYILNRSVASVAAAESYHNLAVAKHCLELFSSAGWMMMKKREPYYSPRRWSDHGLFESFLGQGPKLPKRFILRFILDF